MDFESLIFYINRSISIKSQPLQVVVVVVVAVVVVVVLLRLS